MLLLLRVPFVLWQISYFNHSRRDRSGRLKGFVSCPLWHILLWKAVAIGRQRWARWEGIIDRKCRIILSPAIVCTIGFAKSQFLCLFSFLRLVGLTMRKGIDPGPEEPGRCIGGCCLEGRILLRWVFVLFLKSSHLPPSQETDRISCCPSSAWWRFDWHLGCIGSEGISPSVPGAGAAGCTLMDR